MFRIILLLALIFSSKAFSQSFIKENVVSLEDSLALMEFYESTKSSTLWKHRVYDWKNKRKVSQFPGVKLAKVNGVYRVISLSLRGNKTYYLSGELNDALSKLTYLQQLELSNNKLYGKLPEAWSNLEHLVVLFIDNNNITGEVPASWSQLTNLQRLNLGQNALSGNPFATLSSLQKLQHLQLYSNRFSGELNEDLGKLSALMVFNIAQNEFTGNPFEILSSLRRLLVLNLAINKFSGEVPQSFAMLDHLQQLNLAKNNFSGNGLDVFSQLKALTFLNLHDNQFSGDIPGKVFYLPQLETVDLSFNDYSGTFPELQTYAFVKQLSVSHNDLSGEIPNLKYFNRLETLDMGHNQFTGEAHKGAVNLPMISYLDLSDNYELVTREILSNINEYKMLKNVDLDNTNINGEIPEFSRPNYILEYIDLDSANLKGGIPESIKNLQALEQFHCSGCDLRELPDFKANKRMKKMSFVDNYLSFEELIKNNSWGIELIYVPQRKTKDSLELLVFENSSITMMADVDGATSYQWFRNGESLTEGDSATFKVLKLKEEGKFTAEAYCRALPDLVLERNPIMVKMKENQFTPEDLPLEVNVGVGAMANYRWENGGEDSVITITEAGDYTVHIDVPGNVNIKTVISIEKAWDEVAPEKNTVVELEEIHFQRSRWVLMPESFEELDKLVDYLNKYPEVNIEIMGHTDNTGKRRENMLLSQNRADAVKEYLLDKGISPRRLVSKGYGSRYPKYSNDTEETRKLNRRVEFKVL